jgi:DNA invertase Pin-like site-specific DNA recombinase
LPLPPAALARERMSRYVRRCRKTGKRGAVYARYSSKFQHSIPDQVRECRRWAEQHGVDVPEDRVFIDERKTGKKSRRDGFLSLMGAVRAREVDVVIIFVTSRLFRKTYKTLKFVEEEIVDRRIRCVFVKSHIDTLDKENWRKLLHVHGLVDELTIQLQVAHIQAAHEGQLRMGVVFGTLTYGYTGEELGDGSKTKLGKPRRKLVIDSETAKWVKQAFAWFINGVSITEIARRLNQAGAPPPDRELVKGWSYTIVRRILDGRFPGCR